MGYKVFVSYKYKDRDVAPLPNVTCFTWCRDYVDYISSKILSKDDLTISRLGYGLPAGGDIEYVDELTLKRALSNRTSNK